MCPAVPPQVPASEMMEVGPRTVMLLASAGLRVRPSRFISMSSRAMMWVCHWVCCWGVWVFMRVEM